MSYDYTSKLGANQLAEEIASEMRMLSAPRMKAFEGLYNRKKVGKAKRNAQVYIGSLRMNKQTNAKGKVNQTHIEAGKTYLDTCWYDVMVCFSYEEMKNGEADIIEPTKARMREASDLANDTAALTALFGEIIIGDPCKLKAYKNICHIVHDGVGLTPQKVCDVQDAVGSWFPNSIICIGVTQQTITNMKQYPEWTNNDLLVGPSAFGGMIQQWGNVRFKHIPDYRNMENISADPFGTLEPVIPAVPYVVGGTWDGVSFIRFLPVWIQSALDYGSMMEHVITPIPEAWRDRDLAYGTYLLRIDENLGFAMNDERGRAVVCVIEKSKALAESWCKSKGIGFGVPDPAWQ